MGFAKQNSEGLSVILNNLQVDSFTEQSLSRYRFASRQLPLHKGAFSLFVLRDMLQGIDYELPHKGAFLQFMICVK